jgi:hypothetical protein
VITLVLSVVAVFLCSIPYTPQQQLPIEPELIETFKTLDENTKVCDAAGCDASNHLTFAPCSVWPTLLSPRLFPWK